MLNPPAIHTPAGMTRNRDPQLPCFDLDLNTWVAPFFMGSSQYSGGTPQLCPLQTVAGTL
ncbi:MAG: hypothetical protein KME15_26825 [Drouetiella hepatica Uher 2000/2452]|uniref:Uncharacterized protein n=1 Tax=Drouetiella hepatica Uher 2000/2452 TaxID=904376 RepID=A0A951QJB5_9CYAN|nr:hypothetical protein [Drouetiella hepatica Uher 2000/2452]